MKKLQSKNIWITGSARGLGLETAKLAAEAGANVFFGSRKSVDYYLEKEYFSQEFLEKQNVHFLTHDVTDKASLEKAYAVIDSCCGGIDILINNAGIVSASEVIDVQEDDFQNIMRVNCLGSLFTAQTVLPRMKEKNSGAIINITSIVINKAFPQNGVYAASKAAQTALFRSLREELRNTNIKVINLAPGATNTEIWHHKLREKFSAGMMTPESLAESVVSVAELSQIKDTLIEEITIRPQGGDL